MRIPLKNCLAVVAVAALFSSGVVSSAFAQDAVTLRGAALYDEDHVYTRTLRKFESLVQEYYDGDVEFVLSLNSELGADKDYFQYMSQGISVDYGIIAPSHMSTFAPGVSLLDVPFLYRDPAHWEAVLAGEALNPIKRQIADKADVMILGFAGGGVRNIVANEPVRNMEELENLPIRVMGAPIQAQSFQAAGASPQVISWSEIYNALQTGVVDAAENEAAGIASSKLYEVANHVSLTRHIITVRPLAFSGKTFRELPEALQEAVLKAGREASSIGRQTESKEDSALLSQLEEEGKIVIHEFKDRDALAAAVVPALEKFAADNDSTKLLKEIRQLN